MRKTALALAAVFMSFAAFAFPLKEIKEGDRVDMKKFAYSSKAYTDKEDKAPLKVLLLWKGDKRLSKNTFEEFKQFCEKSDVVCVAVELGVDETLKPVKNVIYAADTVKMTDSWGIFTLPVTLVLDGDNKIIHGLGFEGQYRAKLEKFIELKQGKISEAEYQKITNVQGVDKTVSKLPEINFAKNMIKSGQTEDARKRLAEIDPAALSDTEKTRLAEAYFMLKEYGGALEILKGIKSTVPEVRFLLGYAYMQTKNYEEALSELESVKDIYPRKERVYYALAKIYYEKDMYKEAADYFNRCCEIVIDF
ncbi:tetratricopeptide repeat protein [Geovibrio thiophilus]|uniref:Tetratricopeptide repeat protein n=1 Tax=Geovibrio thiophilus TaxID=139438 RepID=A0A410JX17_9BACT|nr:tetratricopeptide repeat protein [Geovibrio thiophilus]QAR32571.1 tetratricopeptide repeat protein [Geovibrio thiophilus]